VPVGTTPISGLDRADWHDLSMLIGSASDGTPLKIGVSISQWRGPGEARGPVERTGARLTELASLYGTS
jgi:hypothetical protein